MKSKSNYIAIALIVSAVGTCALRGFGRVSLLPDKNVSSLTGTGSSFRGEDMPKEKRTTHPIQEEVTQKKNATNFQKANHPHPIVKGISNVRGNLPAEYEGRIKMSGEAVKRGPEEIYRKDESLMSIAPRGLRMGDMIDVQISESVIAWEGGFLNLNSNQMEAPVRGTFQEKNTGTVWVLMGEARLDPRTDRVSIRWSRMRKDASDPQEYSFEGVSMGEDGAMGLQGEVHSKEGLLFAGEVISAGAAGMTEAGLDKRESLRTGEMVETKSESNLIKRALIAALGKTGERFSDKLKSSQRFSFVRGPVRTQVLITKSLSQSGGF